MIIAKLRNMYLKLIKIISINFFIFFILFVTSLSALQNDCKITQEMKKIPNEVYVDIYPIIITSINEMESSFDYQFYLGYWRELDEISPYCFFESDDLSEGIFNPYFEFMNAINIERTTSYGVEIEDGGVYVDAKYNGKFKGDFDFTMYPFDTQNLHIDISSTYSKDDFKIILEDQTNSLLEDLEIQGWDKINFQTELGIEKWDQDDEEYDLIRYTLTLDRQVLTISLRLFLPLLVIVFLNFLSLTLERNDFETKVEIQLAALIAVAAYSILMDTKIPDLPYLTIADTIIALSFFSSAIILAISILKKRKRDKQN